MRQYSPAALDQHLIDPAPVPPRRERVERETDLCHPGHAFNSCFTEGDVLEWMGFEPSHADARGEHWVRPGKSARDGSSATVFDEGDDSHVTIWSDTVTEWYPQIEVRHPYDAWGLFVRAFWDGDWARAAQALVEEGYGERADNSELEDLLADIAADIIEEPEGGSSWRPMSGAEIFDGPTEPPPDLFERQGGLCLLYRGRINAFQGEPESAKSWGALCALTECIQRGGRGLLVDFENLASSVRDRLVSLGLTRDEFASRFDFMHPVESLDGAGNEYLQQICDNHYDMIVIDGTTDGMSLLGLDPMSNADASTWNRVLLERLAGSGAAVVTIDHVTKSQEGRGLWAIGAQHKKATITGAQYIFEKVHDFGRGMKGMSRLRIGKDKGGYNRQHADNEIIAEFWLDGTVEDEVTWDLLMPTEQSHMVQAPAHLMETISNYLAVNHGERKATILTMCQGTAAPQFVAAAFDKLKAQGYIRNDLDDKNCWRLVRPFHEVDVIPTHKVLADVDQEKRMDNLRSNAVYAQQMQRIDGDISPTFMENRDDSSGWDADL